MTTPLTDYIRIALSIRKRELDRKITLLADRGNPVPPGDFHLLVMDIAALEAHLLKVETSHEAD